jgi:hypothetical protein
MADLLEFREPATGFSTTDLYDAHDRVIQFTKTGDLVWTADGTRLAGYSLLPDAYNPWGPPTYWITPPKTGNNLYGNGGFSIRFGSFEGRRRAYLTQDYGHYNPGTLVAVEVVGGALVVTQTSSYPPGTPTLSGVVTRWTPDGPVPLPGATLYRGIPGGVQDATTNEHGSYELRGLLTGTDTVSVMKEGYRTVSLDVTIDGDRRLDFELVRQ